MNILLTFVNRNLKVFLRNKTVVFYSFLSVLVIIGLYALFLGDVQISNIESDLGSKIDGIGWLVNSWIMAGLLSVNTVTVTLGTFGIMVNDLESERTKDFLTAPISRTQIIFGYQISSWIISFILNIISFIVVEIYVIYSGGEILTLKTIILTILLMILSIISSSSVIFYIVTFIKSSHAFGTLSTLIGTFIGFIAGIYIPIGALPKNIQNLISLIPVSYTASLLRQMHMEQPTSIVFKDAPTKMVEEYYRFNGVKLFLGDYELSWFFMVFGLIIVAVVFYSLSLVRILRNKF